MAVVDAHSLSRVMFRREVHQLFVTGVMFSPTGKSILSVSGDYSALATEVSQDCTRTYRPGSTARTSRRTSKHL